MVDIHVEEDRYLLHPAESDVECCGVKSTIMNYQDVVFSLKIPGGCGWDIHEASNKAFKTCLHFLPMVSEDNIRTPC